MTDLQISLLGIGGLIVLGVMVYNQWQLRRGRKNRPIQPEQSLPANRGTAPTPFERQEPSLSTNLQAETTSASSTTSDASSTAEPLHDVGEGGLQSNDDTKHPEDGNASNPANLLWASPQSVHIDPIIDCVIPLRADTSFSSEKILPFAALLRRAGSKPVLIEGLNQQSKEWESVRAGQTYVDLQVAVQLANRTGPLNALEFSEFVGGVQRFADALDAQADFPDMNETVANARELDAFALQCDAQLGVNIISDGAPWSAAYVQTIATQDGLVLSRDGTRFTRYFSPTEEDVAKGLSQNLSPIFTLQFANTNFLRDDLTHTASRQISLSLDVPSAEEDIRPFRLMCEYANSLASRMGARVVDDNQHPLPEAALSAIEKQLMSLYSKLEARGIPAGSATALRLFSH